MWKEVCLGGTAFLFLSLFALYFDLLLAETLSRRVKFYLWFLALGFLVAVITGIGDIYLG